MAGAKALIAKLRGAKASPIDIERARAERRDHSARVARAAKRIVRQVEAGAAAVELLDSLVISGKRLGDCTQRDLLNEAEADTSRAAALSEHAAWLRRLASILQPNDTVRTAERSLVLSLLREHAA